MGLDNYMLALGGVLILGLIAVVLAFRHMKPGFGTYNLKVIGIILVATFATILGIIDTNKMTAAIGILGAIAGYLFGFSKESSSKS